MQIICRKKADRRWIRWMQLGERMGCHQRPERSFFVGGYQVPVCARCTGVVIGYLVSIPVSLFRGWKHKETAAYLGMTVMLADWSVQALKIKESTNKRRLITGICGGFGIMTLWISLIKFVIASCKKGTL